MQADVSHTGLAAVVVAAEPLTRLGLVDVLKGFFTIAQEVDTASAARQALDALTPSLAVIVLDPPLPDAPLEEACRLLIRRHSATANLVLLRRPRETQVRLVCSYGAQGVFDTRIEPEALLSTAMQLSTGTLAVDPSFTRYLMRAPVSTDSSPDTLTGRQLETLKFLADGYSSKEIARLLATTTEAVDHIIERLVKRLGAHHRAHLVAIAMRTGLLS